MTTKVQVEVSYGHHVNEPSAQVCWFDGQFDCSEFGDWNVKGWVGEFRSCSEHLATIIRAVNDADIKAEGKN